MITVYAFSIENFKRSEEEFDSLKILMRQFEENGTFGTLIRQHGLSLRLSGRPELLNDETREILLNAVNRSRHGTRGIFNVCVAYTSRDEMTRAMKKTVESCSSIPSSITSQSLSENLDTADQPSPDILVRTSGVTRLSDFLLWQCHQDTDIQFVDRLWPEFRPWDLFLIITQWQRNKSLLERGQPKRSGWRKTNYDPESAHIRLISTVSVIFLVLVVILWRPPLPETLPFKLIQMLPKGALLRPMSA